VCFFSFHVLVDDDFMNDYWVFRFFDDLILGWFDMLLMLLFSFFFFFFFFSAIGFVLLLFFMPFLVQTFDTQLNYFWTKVVASDLEFALFF
jgi:hypothetical protein